MPALSKSREFAFKRRLTHGFEQLESRRLLHAGTHGTGDLPDDVIAGENALPEFALVDANPSSSTFDDPVSPRDHLGQISVWMFGYST